MNLTDAQVLDAVNGHLDREHVSPDDRVRWLHAHRHTPTLHGMRPLIDRYLADDRSAPDLSGHARSLGGPHDLRKHAALSTPRGRLEDAPRQTAPMLTLDDIFELYLRYVPTVSRHESAEDLPDTWWPAHELGHLLTVPRCQIGKPMFGLPQVGPCDPNAPRSYAYELAAMSISRRLLKAVGQPKLFDQELEASEYDVIHYGSHACARRILRRRNLLRLPHDHPCLEARVRRALLGTLFAP